MKMRKQALLATCASLIFSVGLSSLVSPVGAATSKTPPANKAKAIGKRVEKIPSVKKKLSSSKAGVSFDKNDKQLVAWGDVGNTLTVVLSFILLAGTPFNLGPCAPGPCDVEGYEGLLDECYVCDGFCISSPDSRIWNSHMLSLYSDLIFTIPLLILRQVADLEKLGLDEFFLSNLKVYSVAGHGIAHWALSLLTLAGIKVESSLWQQVTAVALFLARFAHRGALEQFSNIINELLGKQVDTKEMDDLAVKNRRGILRSTVAPVLTGILLALLAESPPEPTLVNYLVFGLTCFVFFEAGIPPAANNWIFSVLMSAVTTYIAVGVLGVNTIQHSFTIVFTSAYLVSALYQMFFWNKEKKRAHPYPYMVSAWASNLLTTLVGWLLALKCTNIKEFGGHVWYDFSISTSYFLLYYLAKKEAEKQNK